MNILRPPKLRPDDTIRFVSPASTPSRAYISEAAGHLESMGLKVEIGDHAFDQLAYLAGADKDRLADLNDAIRDPNVNAIMATRGGKGAYRIADGIDFAALRENPKLLIGFSEITVLHLAIQKHCGIAGLHGASWTRQFSESAVDSLEYAMFGTEPIVLTPNDAEPTSSLTTRGTASGILIGGNQDMLATAAGWALPDLDGAILLLEAFNLRLGHIDRQLTMLANGGHLQGIQAVAVGQYTECGQIDADQRGWTEIDVLRDHLNRLNVPVLGGLPIGHGADPVAVPVGTRAVLNADAKTLVVDAAVC